MPLSYLAVEITKITPSEMLSHQNREIKWIPVSLPPSELAPYKFAPYFLSSPWNGVTPNSS